MIGGGKGAFIGGAHRIAAKISNRYELVGGVFDVDFSRAKEFAKEEDLDLRRVYQDIDLFIQGERPSQFSSHKDISGTINRHTIEPGRTAGFISPDAFHPVKMTIRTVSCKIQIVYA